MIMPVERRRLSDAVVDQVSELITAGTYRIGDKLPSERDLAKRLGVSRALVRESFRILESLGLVDVKPGVGALVANNSPKALDIANYLWGHHSQVLEVIEVRDTIVARACGLAAMRMSDDELQALDANYAVQLRVSETGTVDELIQLDMQFHMLIYRAARNTVLLAMEEYSRSVLNNIQFSALTLSTRRSKSLAEHGRIVAALHARDSEQAEQAGQFHAQQTNAEIRSLIERHKAALHGTNEDDEQAEGGIGPD